VSFPCSPLAALAAPLYRPTRRHCRRLSEGGTRDGRTCCGHCARRRRTGDTDLALLAIVFWYRTSAGQFLLSIPSKKTKLPAFEHGKVAAALSAASKKPVMERGASAIHHNCIHQGFQVDPVVGDKREGMELRGERIEVHRIVTGRNRCCRRAE